MPYAKLDENGRIAEWSYEPMEGLDVEFSNGEYVDEKCINGLDDFRIENGMAVYDPTPEKVAQTERAAAIEAMPSYIAALTSAFGEVGE